MAAGAAAVEITVRSCMQRTLARSDAAIKGAAAGDLPLLGVLRKASERCFVPRTIGGGVRDYTASDGSSVTALDVAENELKAEGAKAIAERVRCGGVCACV